MTVLELIERLKNYPQNAEVVIDMECGCFPGFAHSVFVPSEIDKPYGSHTGINNERDVVISSDLLS